ncbi:MAG: dihydrofolate reductase family protein [Pyrinomonadaceae bacterium]
MRSSIFIATSLDGFIARANDGLDWLPSDGGEPHGFAEFMASVDALVMGRKTYDVVAAFETWPYGNKPVIVLSATMSELAAPDGVVCELMNATPQEVVEQLAARGFEHLYIDGGITIQRFLEAGLIQRMTITRIPVLLGNGIPLFGDLPQDVRFEHVNTRSFPSGMVQSEYVKTD